MSTSNLRDTEDRMVQTVKPKRPKTSLGNRRKKRTSSKLGGKLSFNLAEFERSPAEMLNGRHFVIHNRQEFDPWNTGKNYGNERGKPESLGSFYPRVSDEDHWIKHYSHSSAARYQR